MKAVILDSFALHEGDLDWRPLENFVEIVGKYPRTAYGDIATRIGDAEIAIVNKCYIDDAILNACPKLRLVALTATGTDSLDLDACHRHGVTVCNVPAYSTHSVAQMTFALILELCQSPSRHEDALRNGYWQLDIPQKFDILPMHELYGKTLGIFGYGNIGREVAQIALAFGMRVLVHTRTKRAEATPNGVCFVSTELLLQESDILSLHCPATPETVRFINRETLGMMKHGALLVNTARGKLVDEDAVAAALRSGQLGGFAGDVLYSEPSDGASPLLSAPHTMLTPHIAWASQESLERLSNVVCNNVRCFVESKPQNIVRG